jgi:hypothetical protein
VTDGAKVLKTPRGVLLVCQSENTTGALAAILNQNNETAFTAATLNEAWDCIGSGAVGCVVQDLTAPGTDALAFFRAVRSTQSTSTIPFLFLVKKEYKPPLFEGGPELTSDAWVALPCSAQLFLNSLRSLFVRQVSARESSSTHAAVITAGTNLSNEDPTSLLGDARNAILAGQLGTLDVTKILGMVEPLRLTGILKVADGKRLGSVHFVDGNVHHAELNDIEGADALFLLFHLKVGTFKFELSPATDKRTIEGNTMALLLEGLRQMDEAKALVRAFQEKRSTPAAG